MIKFYIIPKSSMIQAMNIFPFLLLNRGLKGEILHPILLNHESIHTRQQVEVTVISTFILLLFNIGWWSLLGVFTFYILYSLEWIIKSILLGRDAYGYLSFELEAYYNEKSLDYLKKRKPFKWIKYLWTID